MTAFSRVLQGTRPWNQAFCESAAGKQQLEEGQKLRFSMPLPYTKEAMRNLLSPTKEMVTDAVKERIRAQRATGKREIFLAEPVRPPARDSANMATAKCVHNQYTLPWHQQTLKLGCKMSTCN